MNRTTKVSGLADAGARDRALDPSTSFLVQAPAGSGKTELLVQRFLRLLSVVDEPEEILAVTFTRKAAAEMRSRIMSALETARAGRAPQAAHLQRGYELARAAVEHERAQGWRLDEQSSRLRIGTIDSVNAWLASRSPLIAGGLSQLRVAEDWQPMYRQAARETVALVTEDGALGNAVGLLLEHCDNRADRVTGLIAAMLERRDQWLRHLGTGEAGDAQRAGLEASLQLLIEISLKRLDTLLPVELREELTELAAFAGAQMRKRGTGGDLAYWDGCTRFPRAVAKEVARWRGIAQLLLKKGGDWRAPGGLNVKVGFPPDSPRMKARMASMLERVSRLPGLREALEEVSKLPDPHYPNAQWEVLKALIRVLPMAAALLLEVFRAQGQTDFSQIAAEALAALNEAGNPTALGMMLDHRLSHLLLDEYQDTSRSQAALLARLTAGWQPGDGRSLFLVGHPMQSIYRFREAEVGVYLETRAGGIGGLQLEFLQLKTNFRSDEAVVEWVNDVFPQLMPDREDPMTGAVPYAASQAYHPRQDGSGVFWHAVAYGDRDAEARQALDVVRECTDQWPEQTIGILVRSRAHAATLIPLLGAYGIEYSAPDLEHMTEEPVVQDLLALTRALIHRADRIAWLAVLRAPWCGLTLADLHALAAPDHDAIVWSSMTDASVLERLSKDGRDRVQRLVRVLGPWLQRHGSCSLRELVEGAWLHLGGPAVIIDGAELDLAEAYFTYLEQVDEGGDCADIVALIDGLSAQTVARPGADTRVQVMTMHKAKGLEFDTVLLPGLGYATGRDSRPLLVWSELAGYGDQAPLVLAPINAQGNDHDPIYELLRSFEKRRAEYETGRLLYVATTRARRRLHLFAAIGADKDGVLSARHGSLLAVMWPAVADRVMKSLENHPDEAGRFDRQQQTGPAWAQPVLRRLPANWASPVPDPGAEIRREQPLPEKLEYDWASRWSMHVGSVVHLWLEEIAQAGVETFERNRLQGLRPASLRLLTRLGTPAADLPRAADRVVTAVQSCLQDETGRWLLSSSHRESASELAISIPADTGFELCRIDRCFVTSEGERWIVDFKTSTHEGAGLEEFLESEAKRYRSQLHRYRDALQRLQPMSTRMALYFPLLRVLHEVE